MSLPFLNHRKIASVIMAVRKPDGAIEAKNEEGEHGPEIMSVAEDLISAVNMKDAKAVADALVAAFDILESSEDESGEDE